MKDGGPAFPIYPRIEGSRSTEISNAIGMTLRDYFAAKAMQGWLANFPSNEEPSVDIEEWSVVAQQSYVIADAMIEARSK